ncbi:MAG: hypothetical protein L0229_29900 [Blastocatellia bacterium]|nr:hypothetical protein [Blastocatellia bacterium]
MSEDETQKFDASDGDRLDQLISLVQAMSLDMRDVKTRLAALEQKVEERLYDTRPVWESVQTQIAELREAQERTREEMLTQIAELDEAQERMREEMQMQIAELREAQERMNEETQAQITELKVEMQTGFRLLNHKFDMLNKHFSDLYADQRETDRRVGELEKRVS